MRSQLVSYVRIDSILLIISVLLNGPFSFFEARIVCHGMVEIAD